ncbi:MAG: hypothetical protein A3F74_03785 [Betaproteobacteria bacterium RIFCSPLOWO2_12_FULL_62_58]|nr:MAG: hypothetical protein A3F74_03785 [Betaproteobacteria bacterium RIFCSPLOWO2_12_FULL_62_58]
MKTLETAKASDTSLTQGLLYALRYWLGGRRGLIAVAVLAVVGGVVLNWSWLVAAGIAPLILAALPCVAMCALGLCASKMGGKSCSNERNEAKVVGKHAENQLQKTDPMSAQHDNNARHE